MNDMSLRQGFGEIAFERNRCRPNYPDEAIDQDCGDAGTGSGAGVLAVGST
jgi:hypothetical protein